MKLFFRHIIILVLLAFTLQAEAGISDTLQSNTTDQINNQLENMAENTDLQLDFSDLTGDYLYYSTHTININGNQSDKLLQLHLINEYQFISIQNYIRQNGPILSKYELQFIPGLDRYTLSQLLPFINTTPPSKSGHLSLRKALKSGQHQIILRYQQQIEKPSAYKTPPDSAFEHPGSTYLGPPEKLYLRYGFNASERIRFGITAEKDAGEIFPFSPVGDSVLQLLHGKKPGFPDFLSAFAYVSGIGILKTAIIGDYHLEFGQGLTLWSGLTFGKSSAACNVKYFGRGIRPNTSVNENRFFHGAAATLGYKDVDITLFYSNQKADGNLLPPDSVGKESISSIQESGNHRTINELLDKNALRIRAYGLHVSYKHQHYSVGATYYKTLFNPPLKSGNKPYQRFYFQGNQLQNIGIDFNYSFQKIMVYGEMAGNPGKNVSAIVGIDTYLNDRLRFSLFYRNISRSYQVLFASPFIENSRVNNERGIYLGMVALLAKNIQLSAYADYYSFPWLKYRVNAPSTGKAFLVQLNYDLLPKLSMYFRFRYKEKQENVSSDYGHTDILGTTNDFSYRYFITYSIFDFLQLKNRLEYVLYKNEGIREKGVLFYQDLLYRPASFPLEFSFRYALFDTDGWESRIYAYENDVLYAFSIPPYYGKGERIYLMLRWKPAKRMSLWLRFARTTWFDRTEIGSGPNLISGNHKTEIKMQWMYKF